MSNQTELPNDGYYIARVQYDTGGTLPTYVHVHDGIICANDGSELRAEACSEFAEIGMLPFCSVWPERAAIELDGLRKAMATLRKTLGIEDGRDCLEEVFQMRQEVQTLRTANAGLVERVKRLEEAGDAHREWVPVSFQKEWDKAKGNG